MLLGTGMATFCYDTRELLQVVGIILTIIKIAIPLIIMAVGLVDLGKAAISSKPEEVKKCVTSLAWRAAGGIAIFFIPTLVMVVFGIVNKFNDAKTQMDFDRCYSCITAPWSGCL